MCFQYTLNISSHRYLASPDGGAFDHVFCRCNLTMVFARTVGNLTKIFLKSQIPEGSPGGGMIAVGIDLYMIIAYCLRFKCVKILSTRSPVFMFIL